MKLLHSLLASLFIVTLSFLSQTSFSLSTQQYYTAAVVEYSPILVPTPVQSVKDAQHAMLKNFQNYEEFASNASSNGAQIIVFPEYGLTGNVFDTRDSILPYLEVIPDPTQSDHPIIPCDDSSFTNRQLLQSGSCIAKNYQMYVVFQMGAVEFCHKTQDPSCPDDGRYQFNAQVAFSPQGELLSRYYKLHLYKEPFYNVPPNWNVTYFDTSFGVRFGQMICFDSLFAHPSLIYSKLNISSVVFSTKFVNVPPFETASQVQQAWSDTFQGTLLAANIGQGRHTSGSGIYKNGVPFVTFYNPTSNYTSRLLMAQIPIDQDDSTSSSSSSNSVVDFEEAARLTKVVRESIKEKVEYGFPSRDVLEYVWRNRGGKALLPDYHLFLAEPGTSGSWKGQSGNVTCSFHYEISTQQPKNESEYYLLMTWEAQEIVGLLDAPIRSCTIARCRGSMVDLCQPYVSTEAHTVFTQFSIEGDNFDSQLFSVLGLVATDKIQLLPRDSYDFQLDAPSMRASLVSKPGFEQILFDAVIMSVTGQ